MTSIKFRRRMLIAGLIFTLFLLFTAAVWTVDVEPIGPAQSKVGFAAINGFVFRQLGESVLWYQITEWLGYIAMLVAFGFAVLGLWQWIKRKSIARVDRDLIAIGLLYAAVIACYLFFELFVVNYRPILIDGTLEASYPSSHTMIVLCIMVTAIMQFHRRIQRTTIRRAAEAASAAVIAVMVFGRLASGVHWCTDIVGSILLSTALILLYAAACSGIKRQNEKAV